MTPEFETLIYFIRAGENGPIKIGQSTKPMHRLEALMLWSPLPLTIVAVAPGMRNDEYRLHYRFRAHWLHHEWFSPCVEISAFIEDVAKSCSLPADGTPMDEVRAWRRQNFIRPHGRGTSRRLLDGLRAEGVDMACYAARRENLARMALVDAERKFQQAIRRAETCR